MRIGILSYPMLFQREGGLQVQVRSTIQALQGLERHAGHPLEVEMVDPCRSRLDRYDVVHVFSATNGNHRIVETAVDLGVPVLLSALVAPGWNGASGTRARFADRLLGKLTEWNVQSSYAQMRTALEKATRIVALGEGERRAISDGFLIDTDKVEICPNGVASRFFSTGPELFRARTGISGPFVLMVGAISPYKNQLGMAQALADLALPLVLIGEAQERDQDYLGEVRQMRGVLCLGGLRHDDPMLASAYAAAAVCGLPSRGEVFPLAVIEALASGTPVVMTDQHALDLPNSEFALKTVRWDDSRALTRAVLDLISTPPVRSSVRALVNGFTWERVAAQLAGSYLELAGEPVGGRCAV